MTERIDQLEDQLGQLGFYREGKPGEGMLRAEDLKHALRWTPKTGPLGMLN